AALTQPPITNTTNLPTHFAILLFPSFQSLDAFGPLDVLSSLSLFYPTLSMHISVLSATIAPVSTRVLSTPDMNMTHGDFGESVIPTDTYANVLARGGKAIVEGMNGEKMLSDIEVLLVPGGGGTRHARIEEEISFVREMYPRLKYVISVCTGATILSRAGVLDGKSATSNKRAWDWIKSTSDKVNWIHQARWVVDGNTWTSSGVSAGIDVTYAFLSEVYGETVADFVAKSSEYVRWTNASYDPFSEIW
ncbi:class I glutamine amidotransferase-like protein, partial [Delitschia confertaspora ATCC 74209]